MEGCFVEISPFFLLLLLSRTGSIRQSSLEHPRLTCTRALAFSHSSFDMLFPQNPQMLSSTLLPFHLHLSSFFKETFPSHLFTKLNPSCSHSYHLALLYSFSLSIATKIYIYVVPCMSPPLEHKLHEGRKYCSAILLIDVSP